MPWVMLEWSVEMREFYTRWYCVITEDTGEQVGMMSYLVYPDLPHVDVRRMASASVRHWYPGYTIIHIPISTRDG